MSRVAVDYVHFEWGGMVRLGEIARITMRGA